MLDYCEESHLFPQKRNVADGEIPKCSRWILNTDEVRIHDWDMKISIQVEL